MRHHKLYLQLLLFIWRRPTILYLSDTGREPGLTWVWHSQIHTHHWLLRKWSLTHWQGQAGTMWGADVTTSEAVKLKESLCCIKIERQSFRESCCFVIKSETRLTWMCCPSFCLWGDLMHEPLLLQLQHYGVLWSLAAFLGREESQ